MDHLLRAANPSRVAQAPSGIDSLGTGVISQRTRGKGESGGFESTTFSPAFRALSPALNTASTDTTDTHRGTAHAPLVAGNSRRVEAHHNPKQRFPGRARAKARGRPDRGRRRARQQAPHAPVQPARGHGCAHAHFPRVLEITDCLLPGHRRGRASSWQAGGRARPRDARRRSGLRSASS